MLLAQKAVDFAYPEDANMIAERKKVTAASHFRHAIPLSSPAWPPGTLHPIRGASVPCGPTQCCGGRASNNKCFHCKIHTQWHSVNGTLFLR